MTKRRKVIFAPEWYEHAAHQGVVRFAREAGWELQSYHHMKSLPTSWEGDGVITFIGSPGYRDLALAATMPVIDMCARWKGVTWTHVIPDNEQLGELAADFFTKQGYRKTLMIGLGSSYSLTQRITGFRKELRRQQQASPEVLTGPFEIENFSRQVKKTIESQGFPLGIFVTDDGIAAELIRICSDAEWRIPQQVAIIGCGGDPLICDCTQIPLASVRIEWEEIGYRAAEELQREMDGDASKKSTILIPSRGISLRQSCDAFAYDDALVVEMLTFIHKNSLRPLTIGDLTENFPLSRRQLERRFEQVCGRSLKEEISQQRLYRLKQYLLHGKSISECADKLGFSSVHYLSTFFRRESGQTLSEWRNSSK